MIFIGILYSELFENIIHKCSCGHFNNVAIKTLQTEEIRVSLQM